MSKTIPADARSNVTPEPGRRHYEQVAAWLEANDFAYAEYPEDRYFSLRQSGDAGDWRVVIDVSDGSGGCRLLVFSFFSIKVPPGRRAEVAELLTGINANLHTGNFEMDWDTGEVRVRASMPLLDGGFTDAQFEALFYGNVGIADRYLAGLCGVAFGSVTPALVLEMAGAPAKSDLQ